MNEFNPGDDEYLEAAIEASERGVEVLRRNRSREYEVSHKTPDEIVTEVDVDAQAAIEEYLLDRYPTHGFVGEESETSDGSAYRWIVDPLDGTDNYVHGFPHYCVTVALEADSEVVLGVVNDPGNHDLYVGVRGEGAWRNGRRLTVSITDTLAESLIAVGNSPPTPEDERFFAMFRELLEEGRTRGIRRVGAGGIDASLVARGVFDGFVDEYTSPWDVSGASLIVEEAGGTVTTLEGEDVDFDVGKGEVDIVASNGRIHDELLDIYASTADD